MVGRCDTAGRHTAAPDRRRHSGLSLVEMLVAIVVALILVAGIIQLLISNKQAYRLQEGFSMLNENGRCRRDPASAAIRAATTRRPAP
jgi:type IV pilus assembly protein PilW